jgi:two-component system response regulator VicR
MNTDRPFTCATNGTSMHATVLAIDDEPVGLRSLRRVLVRAGYDVVTAACCSEARACAGTFDIGLFDIDLPDGNGVDLARELLDAGKVRAAVFFSSWRSEFARAALIGSVVDKVDGAPALLDVLRAVRVSTS